MRSLALVFAFCLSLGGCSTPFDRGAALTVVPFSLQSDGNVVIDVGVNGAGPFRFAIDTAATRSFLLPAVYERLELVPLADTSAIVYGAVTAGEYPIVEVTRLSVGAETWRDARLIALPETTSATAGLDGVLGTDFLSRYSVGFDTRVRALRLYDPATVAERSYRGWSAIALRGRLVGRASEPLHFLEFSIDGRSIPALLDLGAGISILNTPAAIALGLAATRREQAGEFSGALGSEPIVARLADQAITTGQVAWRNESLLIADPEIFATLDYADDALGILGSGLFLQRDLIIDFARDRLLVRWQMGESPVFAENGL